MNVRIVLKFLASLAVCAILLSGCVAGGLPATPSATPEAKPTSTAEPTAAPTAVPPLPSATPGPQGLRKPLYILVRSYCCSEGPSNQGVWRLDPGADQVQRLTPKETEVSAFAIASDGRWVYGTEDGKIFLATASQDVRMLYDAGRGLDYPVTINGLGWSPDGRLLAFTVVYSAAPYMSNAALQATGLWLLDVESGQATQLVRDRYIEAEGANIGGYRVLSDPVWSPDGAALKVEGHFYGWNDVLWLSPIAPDPEGNSLRRAKTEGAWNSGTWSLDGKSLVVSGAPMATISDIWRTPRDAGEPVRLLGGEAAGLYATDAQEIPGGIAFLGTGPVTVTQELRLYLGREEGGTLSYTPAGPEHSLCPEPYAQSAAWDASGGLAAVACESGQLRLASLDGKVDVDLTPELGAVANEGVRQLYFAP